MADVPDAVLALVARVGTPGQPAFQLRKGEEGLSVFDPNACEPPLTEAEILEPFRPGSIVLYRTVEQILEAGLGLVATSGAEVLPDRLRAVHREIVAGPAMTRSAFKAALKLLE
jgi:hypothetical protein